LRVYVGVYVGYIKHPPSHFSSSLMPSLPVMFSNISVMDGYATGSQNAYIYGGASLHETSLGTDRPPSSPVLEIIWFASDKFPSKFLLSGETIHTPKTKSTSRQSSIAFEQSSNGPAHLPLLHASCVEPPIGFHNEGPPTPPPDIPSDPPPSTSSPESTGSTDIGDTAKSINLEEILTDSVPPDKGDHAPKINISHPRLIGDVSTKSSDPHNFGPPISTLASQLKLADPVPPDKGGHVSDIKVSHPHVIDFDLLAKQPGAPGPGSPIPAPRLEPVPPDIKDHLSKVNAQPPELRPPYSRLLEHFDNSFDLDDPPSPRLTRQDSCGFFDLLASSPDPSGLSPPISTMRDRIADIWFPRSGFIDFDFPIPTFAPRKTGPNQYIWDTPVFCQRSQSRFFPRHEEFGRPKDPINTGIAFDRSESGFALPSWLWDDLDNPDWI
jgi:hypothetical protein